MRLLGRPIIARDPQDKDGSLEQRLVPGEQVHHSRGVVDEGLSVQAELGEARILADQVSDRVLEPGNDLLERGTVGRALHVFDDIHLDALDLSQHGESVRRGASMGVVVERDPAHSDGL